MNILCTICSDLLAWSDSISAPCGHIFHFQCLSKWLQRSLTCPQCRKRTTKENICKLYPNFSSNNSVVAEDVTSLLTKIDSMTSELAEKSETIGRYIKEISDLKGQLAVTKQVYEHMKIDVDSKDSAIVALKEQIQYYKYQCADLEKERELVKSLQEKVKKLEVVQALIDTSMGETNDAMLDACYMENPSSLVTFVSVLKRELSVNFRKRKDLKEKLKELQSKLTRAEIRYQYQCQSLTEERTKRKELEEILTIQENEKVHLQSKLLDVHVATFNCIGDKISLQKQECKQHENKKESNAIINECATSPIPTPKIEESNSPVVIDLATAGDTPKNIKSQGFFSITSRNLKKNSSNMKVPSILAKKSKFNQPDQSIISNSMTFDGFGGHAKYDKFPIPLRNSNSKRVKETKIVRRLNRLDRF